MYWVTLECRVCDGVECSSPEKNNKRGDYESWKQHVQHFSCHRFVGKETKSGKRLLGFSAFFSIIVYLILMHFHLGVSIIHPNERVYAEVTKDYELSFIWK